MKRIVFDIDGTLVETKKDWQLYTEVSPLPDISAKLHYLRELGYYIILQTARGMGTHRGNIGKVNKDFTADLIEYLKKYNIPYDELFMGKPSADYYVDDKSYKNINELFKALDLNEP